jgi:putative redox protein
MKINMRRVDDNFLMEAVNSRGNTVLLDADPETGGQGAGIGPMQVLIAAMGACSTIDLVIILRKKREDIKDLTIEIDAERQEGKPPSLYSKIHAHYTLFGDLDPVKVERSLELSVEKYCSVAETLKLAGAGITWSYDIKPFEG